MTTITEALNRIARQCGVNAPSSWITATRADHVEIRDDFFQESIADILDRLDLPAPIGKQVTIVGTGAENYALPSDFLRLQRDELAMYDTQLDRKVEPISNDGEWTYIKDIGTAGIIRYYRIKGYPGNFSVDFYDEPSSGLEIVVSYVADLWMATAAGVVGKQFTAEDDVLLLPRRLVETGAVWRFRERRGLPYEDKYSEYEALLARTSNDKRGRRLINMGEPIRDVRWQDLIPAFIPEN